MSTISRKKPNSIDGRFSALQKAKNRHDSVPPAQDVLTAATVTRLDLIFPKYQTAMNDLAVAKAASGTSTGTNSPALAKSALFTNHFIQVFNLGVTRGVYTKEQRAFFGLDINQASVPDLKSEADVLMWGQKLKDGDPLRVTAGGAAMANPTIAQCNTAYDGFVTINNAHLTTKESFDLAQEALDALTTEADRVILKVWDEAETFYNEETPASMRNNCRLWGVVYVSQGPAAIVNITVEDNVTGVPITTAFAKIEGVNDETPVDADGKVKLTTHVVGDEILVANAPDYIENKIPQTIEEGGIYDVVIKLTHV